MKTKRGRHIVNGKKAVYKKVSTVRQLKRKYNDLPLSYLFGIGEEIDFQCPIIDEYIENRILQKKFGKSETSKKYGFKKWTYTKSIIPN